MRALSLLPVLLLAGPVIAWQGRVHKVDATGVTVYSTEAVRISPGKHVFFLRAGKVSGEGEVLEVLHTQVRVRLVRGVAEKHLMVSDVVPGTGDAADAANRALLAAVERDDKFAVIDALKAGASGAAKSPSGRPAILIAAANNNADIVNLLMVARADVNAPGIWGETALMVAVQNNNIPIIRILLNAGADLARRDAAGSTALCLSVRSGSPELVKLLVSSGADPNLPNTSGETPLWLATEQDRPEIASILLSLGAKVSQKNKTGLTPLAVARRRKQATLIQILEAAGAQD